MPSKAVYARLNPDLYDKVKVHAERTEQSVSAAIEDLVQRGVEELASEGRSESLEEELMATRERLAQVEGKLALMEGEKKALEGQVDAWKTKGTLALSAQQHARSLEQQANLQAQQITQIREYLLTPVATCTNCRTNLRLFDVGQRRCGFCGSWGLDWLPQYRPPPTVWETLRDGAAVVGGAAVVAALLNALVGGSQKA